jgi:HPt (histidine-containing phosphotransfer) domain-containing protein
MNVSPIDKSVFDELCETAGTDFAADLVQTFLQEAPQMLADLREALAAGNAERFRRTAHSLKSNANTFGAVALAEGARALELGGVPVDAGQIRALESELESVAAALNRLVAGADRG